ncbi:MAG: hypothetical protein ACRD5K_14565 [Candidatus Acidiferrales bacterium]
MLVNNMCLRCGGEFAQKSLIKLSLAGIAFLLVAFFLLFFPLFWLASMPLAAVGIYLLIWSVFGKGKWCRRCKKFPLPKSLAG